MAGGAGHQSCSGGRERPRTAEPQALGAGSPRAALEELQRAAGNRAMAQIVARWIAPPGNRWDISKPPPGGWKDNKKAPLGAVIVQHKGKWYRWYGKEWRESDDPNHPAPKKTAAPTPAPAKKPAAQPAPPRAVEPPADAGPIMGAFQPVPNEWVRQMLDYLTPAELRALRETNRRFNELATPVLRTKLAKAIKKTALSSLDGKLQDHLRETLLALGPDKLFVLSDQISKGVVEALAKDEAIKDSVYRPQTSVYGGEHRGQMRPGTTVGNVQYERQIHGPTAEKSSKMHVKSIVGSKDTRPSFLETGSANLTESAMKSNTESVVVLEAKGIAQMFLEYGQYVAHGASTAQQRDFENRLRAFNEHNPAAIRVALAPFVNVGEQLTTELHGADRVVVRMFLVSDAKAGDRNAPLQALCDLASGKAGPKVDVTVIVDKNQAQTQDYVWWALEKLEKAGATVATEQGPDRGAKKRGIMHDKLVFAHYPAGPKGPERYTVMIGSSGLTRNVIGNLNYENLVVIDDKALFDALLLHHTEAEANRELGMPTWVGGGGADD